jgi:hypothetical protein
MGWVGTAVFVSLMSDLLFIRGLQYGGYALEVVLFLLLARRGMLRRLKGLGLYVMALFVVDGVGRPAVLHYFDLQSRQYCNFYWLTDVVLALGAFLLICAFFRRACAGEEKLWRFTRLLLVFSFILVLAISALLLTRNYTQLFTGFIIEFSQNLYFTCLVLNTLLYLMIQQLSIEDDELGFLVCGFGVQFAGEAAALALLHLTFGESFPRLLLSLLAPTCTLGMLATWIYAIGKTPQAVPVRSPMGRQAALAEADVN